MWLSTTESCSPPGSFHGAIAGSSFRLAGLLALALGSVEGRPQYYAKDATPGSSSDPNTISDRFEYYNLITTLAPNESEGPDDKSEWNLFKEYLDSSAQALNRPHDLSSMLRRWQNDVCLASEEEDRLNEVQLKARHALEEKAIRALKRLSGIPMPNMQSSFIC
ncbi:hypothetical protein N7475_005073 [Penicillium sp. IBT 31633x]|nr:hypothetical protein N7475_005073 [Penicillium sp. IBT 31633x]